MQYLSIDIEASGPFPGMFSLVSIGAVPVVHDRGGRWSVDKDKTFYVEVQPLDGAEELKAATEIHGLSAKYLQHTGISPEEAMDRFDRFLEPLGHFTTASWPSSFDHNFLGWYFQRFLSRNPLGHSGFDTPSFAMGLFKVTTRSAVRKAMDEAGRPILKNPTPHNALTDAMGQGETMAWLFNYAAGLVG